MKKDLSICDLRILLPNVLSNQISINNENQLEVVNKGGVDCSVLKDNTRYLIIEGTTFTRPFAAESIYTGTIEIFSSVGFVHQFNDIDGIFYSDETCNFNRIFMREFIISGTPNTSLFSTDPLNPTVMSTWNFSDGIIRGIGMGSLNAGIVHRFSNIEDQQSTWDILVTGLSFLNINNISAVGNLMGIPFGGSQFKIRGDSQGGLSIQTENIVPAGGDKVFDFTELITPLGITGIHHFAILGSGGVYAAGVDKSIDDIIDAGGGEITITSIGHGIPVGNFIDIGTTSPFDYAGNYKIVSKTDDTLNVVRLFLGGATGIFNATVVDQTDPRVFVSGARGEDNPDSQIIGSLGWANNVTTTPLVQNIWSKVLGDTFQLEGGNERCSQTDNNELTFTNLSTHKAEITLSLTALSGSGGGSPRFEFRIIKNGSPLQLNGIDIISSVDTSTSIPRYAGVFATVTTIVGDVFTMEVRNVTNSNAAIVKDGTIIIR